jgi:hypothetical protein
MTKDWIEGLSSVKHASCWTGGLQLVTARENEGAFVFEDVHRVALRWESKIDDEPLKGDLDNKTNLGCQDSRDLHND